MNSMVIRNVLKNLVVLFILTSCTTTKQNNVERIISEFNNSTSPNVLVAAHRGDWRHAPENSIKAIENSIEMGVDIVEVDVRRTIDGHLVLMHDATINRTTNGKGKVSDHTLRDLKHLYLKNNQGGKDAELTDMRIPTLREALLTAKGKIMVNLDKSYGLMKDIYLLLQETGTLNVAIFKGSADAEQVKSDIAFMEKQVLFMPIIGDNDVAVSRIREHIKLNSPAAFEIILSKSDSLLSQSGYINTNGSRVWVNTLWASLCAGYTDAKALKDPDANWGHLIDHGVNIIQTDDPSELLQYLEDMGLRDF